MQKKSKRIFLRKGFNIILSMQLCLGYGLLTCTSCKTEPAPIVGSYVSSIDYEGIDFTDGRSIAIAPDDKIYYLVRHAEKDTMGNDPDLTPIGYDRANELTAIFKSARVDEVYSTMYMRTLMTADSISKSKGLSMKTYDPRSLKEFAERLKNTDNLQRSLIVGHSNTTPELANHIHGKTVLEDFDEKDYDNFIVIIQGENTESQLHQLKFKSRSNTDK